jgi:hypothetical protein
VTWGSGATGVSGVVSSANSLVGTFNQGTGFGDHVGRGGVTALTNGNYVVSSPAWNGGIGAATWADGTTGITGSVSADNSLIGPGSGSVGGSGGGVGVSSGGVTALTNGNYVVDSPFWSAPDDYEDGAVTWGNGTTGTIGTVSASNSLVGTYELEEVGNGGITKLANGNYVVLTPGWNNNRGAATWGDGTTGTTGIVSASNSVVGSTAGVAGGGVTALSNGNYVIKSPGWNNSLGAATWVNGSAAASFTVSASNSLVGSNAAGLGDQVSSGGVIPLPNGNFVVLSPLWSVSKGAATWGSGTAGISGIVSSANSLVGSTGGSTADEVGSGGVVSLADGNLVVSSPLWNGAEGAVTWLDGITGTTLDGQNTPDPGNSLLGAAANAGLGQVRLGPVAGSFVAAFSTENNRGRVTVGFVNAGGVGGDQLPFGFLPSQTETLDPDYLEHALNAGTNVVLQANDDITVSSPVTAQPAGMPGNLTLQAGRSLLLNAGIQTAGGNLTLTANESVADGVVDNQRDPGAAAIKEVSGITLSAGSGALAVDLKATTDTTNHSQGLVTLLGVAAGSVTLSAASPLGVTIDGQTPGDGVTVGTYTQTSVTGPINLNGAPLQLTHKVATMAGETFTIVHTTGGVSGTLAGLGEGAVVTADDGTPFTITYQGNGGKDVVLTQDVIPTQLVVTQQPPGSVLAGGLISMAVSAEDAQGNVATSFSGKVTVALANNPGGSTLGGTLTVTANQGVAVFSDLTLNKSGTGYTLQATTPNLTAATTNAFNVTPGAASQLVVTQQPSPTARAGVAFATQPVVVEEDAFGNVLTGDSTHTVTAARGDRGTGALQGTATVTLNAGVATFTDLSYQVAETLDITFSTNAGAITATSADVAVSPAAASQLAITQQPSATATAGVAFATQPVVAEEDQYGNVIIGDSAHTVTAARGDRGTAALQGSTLTVTLVGGVATFSGLSYQVAETMDVAFSTNAAGVAPATSSDVLVSAAAATQLVFGQQPTSAVAGAVVSPAVTVQVEDSYGNVVVSDGSTVTLTLSAGVFEGGSATATATASGGVASFGGLKIDAAGSYTLAASDGSLAGTTSAGFTISPAAASQLVITQQPSATATAGVAFAMQPVVAEEDQYGNVLTGDSTHTVTAARGDHGTAALQGGTLTLTLVGGVATFTGLAYQVAETLDISFSTNAGTFTATSADIAVRPAAASQLVITQQPSATATAGVAFATQPVVAEEDQYGNVLTGDSTHTVTAARGNHGTAALQGGTLTLTLVGGMATFTGLSYQVAETLNITFTTDAAGVTPATSLDVVVSAAAATQLVFGQQPTSAVAGAVVSPAVTVKVEDVYGNVVVSDGSTVTLALSAGVFEGGSATATATASGGVATFGGLKIDTAGTYTLAAGDGSLAGATSASFTVSPAAASQLVVTQQPSTTATAGAAFAM